MTAQLQASERWEDIAGYEGFYKVSSYGKVFSVRTNILLSADISTGYPTVVLSVNRVKKKFLVHRLVAAAFIPNPEGKRCVNHINGIKVDSRVENLEWCTHSENEIHSFKKLGKKIKHSDSTKQKLREVSKGRDMPGVSRRSSEARKGKPSHNVVTVEQYTLDGKYIKTFSSLTLAAQEVNGNPSALSQIGKGKLKTYKKFTWKLRN